MNNFVFQIDPKHLIIVQNIAKSFGNLDKNYSGNQLVVVPTVTSIEATGPTQNMNSIIKKTCFQVITSDLSL